MAIYIYIYIGLYKNYSLKITVWGALPYLSQGLEWPLKLFHEKSLIKYGTGPASNSRPLDLQSDEYLQSDYTCSSRVALRYRIEEKINLYDGKEHSFEGIWNRVPLCIVSIFSISC